MYIILGSIRRIQGTLGCLTRAVGIEDACDSEVMLLVHFHPEVKILGRRLRESREWQWAIERAKSGNSSFQLVRPRSSSSFVPSAPTPHRTAPRTMATSKSTLDLQAARKTASFDSDELNRLLNEGSRDPEVSSRAVVLRVGTDGLGVRFVDEEDRVCHHCRRPRVRQGQAVSLAPCLSRVTELMEGEQTVHVASREALVRSRAHQEAV